MKKYQHYCGDDFFTNKIIQKPKSRKGTLYSTIDSDTILIGGDSFLPTWDSTDHFRFVCEKCKTVADVIQVDFTNKYCEEVKYALFFYLGCPECGATGQRKIYFDMDMKDPCFCQKTLHLNNVFIYGFGKKPNSIVKIQGLKSFFEKKMKQRKKLMKIEDHEIVKIL